MKNYSSYIKEEYDHENDKFEVGDHVIITNINSSDYNNFNISSKNKYLQQTGVIMYIKKSLVWIKLDNNKITVDRPFTTGRFGANMALYISSLKLYEPEDIGDMEEWDEINESKINLNNDINLIIK